MFNTKNKIRDNLELGFGTKTYQENVRFLNADGTVNVKRRGLKWRDNIDIYHWLITTTSINLFLVIVGGYIFVNTIFALVYFALGADQFGGILGVNSSDQFLDLFFFSAQTLTTVGYGHVYPASSAVSSVAAIESLAGLMGFALATGILYGRFSRPKAALLYSENVLISPYKDITGLMFRVANTKQNELIEIEANVVIAYTNPETNRREFIGLPLERSKINFLPLSWTIVHPIDEKSPIYNVSLEDLIKQDVELVILIKAINDTYSQTVYSRMSYKGDSFIEKAKFAPVKAEATRDRKIVISLTDIHKFDTVE